MPPPLPLATGSLRCEHCIARAGPELWLIWQRRRRLAVNRAHLPLCPPRFCRAVLQSKLRFEGGSAASGAAGVLTGICGIYWGAHKQLMWAAKSQYAGPMLVNAVQGALPAVDAFKVGAGCSGGRASGRVGGGMFQSAGQPGVPASTAANYL